MTSAPYTTYKNGAATNIQEPDSYNGQNVNQQQQQQAPLQYAYANVPNDSYNNQQVYFILGSCMLKSRVYIFDAECSNPLSYFGFTTSQFLSRLFHPFILQLCCKLGHQLPQHVLI